MTFMTVTHRYSTISLVQPRYPTDLNHRAMPTKRFSATLTSNGLKLLAGSANRLARRTSRWHTRPGSSVFSA